jgi:hypothetical protein
VDAKINKLSFTNQIFSDFYLLFLSKTFAQHFRSNAGCKYNAKKNNCKDSVSFLMQKMTKPPTPLFFYQHNQYTSSFLT